MAFINEEIKHDSGLLIQVLQYEEVEECDKAEICQLSIDESVELTTKDLCDLGKWLIEKSIYIESKFTEFGEEKESLECTIKGSEILNLLELNKSNLSIQ